MGESLRLTHETTEPPAAGLHGSLEAVYRHVAAAHDRLATAEPLDSDVAAQCLSELHDALELVDTLLAVSDRTE